jgi:hypothetical protein
VCNVFPLTVNAIQDGFPNSLGYTVPHSRRIILGQKGIPAELVEMVCDVAFEVCVQFVKEAVAGVPATNNNFKFFAEIQQHT